MGGEFLSLTNENETVDGRTIASDYTITVSGGRAALRDRDGTLTEEIVMKPAYDQKKVE